MRRSDARLSHDLPPPGDAAELIYLPPTPFLRAVSLGYEHALADVLWFRAIDYFGSHFSGDHLYTWLAYMCDVVTDLDPRAQHVYEFAGVMLPWEANRSAEGIALLEKGTRNMPDAWRPWYLLGFSYYFFKNDLAAASHAFEAAMRLPDTPDFVSQMAATILEAHRGTENAMAFLAELERDTPNREMRGALRERVLELKLTRDIEGLEAAVTEFEARLQRKPRDFAELLSVGVISEIPDEPFGGAYLLDPDSGTVSSSTGHKPGHLQSSAIHEEFLKRGDGGETQPPPAGMSQNDAGGPS